ncbi:hypothetical protein EVAR_32395_1 [Eumeta japonica]|uniref:Uncharacterized protein n=1 Tax=Eumeta variegata TaxID=151549 RepID=A0A4C1VJV2_EUMVA|nr:hypothetical protein EVAR_32395_1 [Eumeta japonica]
MGKKKEHTTGEVAWSHSLRARPLPFFVLVQSLEHRLDKRPKLRRVHDADSMPGSHHMQCVTRLVFSSSNATFLTTMGFVRQIYFVYDNDNDDDDEDEDEDDDDDDDEDEDEDDDANGNGNGNGNDNDNINLRRSPRRGDRD